MHVCGWIQFALDSETCQTVNQTLNISKHHFEFSLISVAFEIDEHLIVIMINSLTTQFKIRQVWQVACKWRFDESAALHCLQLCKCRRRRSCIAAMKLMQFLITFKTPAEKALLIIIIMNPVEIIFLHGDINIINPIAMHSCHRTRALSISLMYIHCYLLHSVCNRIWA